MKGGRTHIILCGDSKIDRKYRNKTRYKVHLFDFDRNSKERNCTIDLPYFYKIVGCSFPDRIKDLLELASYIYFADRKVGRGDNDSLEFQRWSRKLKFIVPVRDFAFWQSESITRPLIEALTFMSGDLSYEFQFVPGGEDKGQRVLTDHDEIAFEKPDNVSVCLFSGGLDSLAGALSKLKEGRNLILITHRSSNLKVSSIQQAVLDALKREYPQRIHHYNFDCNLSNGNRAEEETQRTRIFLYTSIAISLMNLASERQIHVFENGITSLNFPKRADAINSRASRTTHPRTIHLLQNFYSEFSGSSIVINHPFLYFTKSDVVRIIKDSDGTKLINSTLTCTKTFDKSRFTNSSHATHCGTCSQCIDRRFAMYSNEIEKDDAIYDLDIATDSIDHQEGFTHLIDYLYLKVRLEKCSEVSFLSQFTNEITDVIDYIPGTNNQERFKKLYELTKKHVESVNTAVNRIRQSEDLSKKRKNRSIFQILDDRAHLKEPIDRFADEVEALLKEHMLIAYQRESPSNEHVLNDHIQALLKSKGFEREFPALIFGTSQAKPDHSKDDFYIEAKYPRNKKAQSRITEELAADLIKYGLAYKFFAIYDPEGCITDRQKLKAGIEMHKNCRVLIVP